MPVRKVPTGGAGEGGMGAETWEKRGRDYTGGGKRKCGKQDSQGGGMRKRYEKNDTTQSYIFNRKSAQRREPTKETGSGLQSTGSGKV